jgi:hypothetical protein
MDVVALSPVYATSLPWRRDAKSWALTVICKATFDLTPGEMRLSQSQDPIHEQDRWDEDPARGLHTPTDLAPFKVRADVMLAGHAYAPNGKAVRSLLARLVVGGIDKSIAVLGEAALVGVGPVAPDWTQRRGRLKGGATAWSPSEPLDDHDPLFFNAAPGDQQLATLRDDQPLLLEHLHPDHPRLATRLPGLRPQVFVERPHAAIQELEMRADTLWIDTDRGRCSVTWRAHFSLSQRDDPGRIYLAMSGARQPLTWQDMQGLERAISGEPAKVVARAMPELQRFGRDEDDGEEDDTMTIARKLPMTAIPQRLIPAPKPTLQGTPPPPTPSASAGPPPLPPSAGGPPLPPSAAPPPLPPTTPPPPLPATPPPLPPSALAQALSRMGTRELPPGYDLSEPTNTELFVTGEHTPILDASPAWLAPQSAQTPAVPMASATPFPAPAPSPSPPAATSASPQPPAAAPPPLPAMVPSPPVALASAVATLTGDAKSPWAAASAPRISPATPVTPPPLPSPSKPAPPSKAPPARAPAPAVSRPAPADVLDLLWFDPDALPRIRSRFSALIDQLEFEPLDPRHDLPVDDPKASRDRHHAFGVLTQAPVTDAPGVSRAMVEAISDKGRFTPPVVVLSGELRFPFDEVEHLKAAAAAAKPLARDDKRLSDLLEMVNELVGTPLLQGSPGAVDSLLRDLSGAVSASKRPLPVKFLDAHLERVLLEQRRYQKRTVFGAPMLRGLFTPAGSSAPVPAYLPEAVAEKLPLVVQMKVRLIAEASGAQDQYESHPQALRVVALSRAMAVDAWRR